MAVAWLDAPTRRALGLALAVLLGGCSPSPPPAPDVCLAPWRSTAAPSLAPVVQALKSGQIVVLGEHHGDPAELGLLLQLVQAAREQGVVLDVAMELLPRRGQPHLDALHADWTEAGWWSVVAERYHPHPLQLAAYGSTVRGMIAAGARVHALAPDCGPAAQDASALDAAVDCFASRDEAMAGALLELHQPGRGLLVSAGLWHGARRRPEGAQSLAALLEAALRQDVLQVVIAGIEGPDPEGPAGAPGTCAGLARALQTAHPWSAALADSPWLGLPASCLADGEQAGARLGDLFEMMLIPALHAADSTMLPEQAWATMPLERRAAWDRLQTTLMGRSPTGTDAAAWAAQLARSGAPLAQAATPPQDPCAPLRRMGLPVARP